MGSCQEGGEENIPELLTQKLPVPGTLTGVPVRLQHFTPLSRETEISDGLEDLLILSIYFEVLIFGIFRFLFQIESTQIQKPQMGILCIFVNILYCFIGLELAGG